MHREVFMNRLEVVQIGRGRSLSVWVRQIVRYVEVPITEESCSLVLESIEYEW